ncbi:MAG: glycosyl hydrolase family 28-related protein, partial [Roseimicrobium sp.]
MAASLWPSQYKIKPWETDRLTAADVVGPDGVVYPDFTGAGVSGGVPDLDDPSIRSGYTIFDVTTSAYGASANDPVLDDTAVAKALAAALANAATGGKSIVSFPAGTFDLTAPLVINRSNVVVQGAGKGKTILRIGPGGKPGSALFTFTPDDGTPTDFTPWAGQYLAATKNLLRGTNVATLDHDAAAKGYAVGDWIRIQPIKADAGSAMRTRFSKPENHIEYSDAVGHFGRVFIARITAIDSSARTVRFDRSFPHDYFVDEVPQMRKGRMLERCGVQDLTIETISAEVGIDPLSLTQVAESWVRDVHFLKPQNWPYQVTSVVRVEFRGCHFDGTWAPIGSGARSYLAVGTMDMLMQRCQANDMRHMPIFQQSMYCVVRDCGFTGKTVQSPQLHGRFPTENLVERCTFDFPNGKGQSAWATDVTNTLRHGPNGPRNVFYHNVVKSGAGYIRFGGAQENPIIAYNKILRSEDSQVMPGIWASDRTFDAIVVGNAFQVSASNPVIILEDTTCKGWEVWGNHIHGSNRSVWAGDGGLSLEANNQFHPASEAPADPKPEADSIFEWQKANAAKARLLITLERKLLTKAGDTTQARLVRVKADTRSDLEVKLTSDSDAVVMPSTLVIPANAASVEFVIKVGE